MWWLNFTQILIIILGTISLHGIPRNVVLAGQGTAQYLESGLLNVFHTQSFLKKTEKITILDAGDFEAYANRDSNSYIDAYGLEGVENY